MKTIKHIQLTAYYFPATRLLLAYVGKRMVLAETICKIDEDDYWIGIEHEGFAYDVNLSRSDSGNPDEPFCLSLYPVVDGRIDTSSSLPVTFRDCRPRFKIGDKVRFTEQAIKRTVSEFGLDELWAQLHREKEYEVLEFKASPEYDHIIVCIRHTAEDDVQEIAEYNLTQE